RFPAFFGEQFMSAGYPSQPSFFPPSSNQVPPPRRKSWLASLLLIGGGIFILGSVLFLAGIFYVVKNVDRWLVGLGREAIVAMVNEAEIPAADKSEVIAQVDRVVAAYKARQIGQAELQQVLAELEQSPALKALS